jgi:nucleoid-associated protein YgaU
LRHVVEPGQSVYEIAQRYYDNGRYWESIQQANPDKVSEDGTVVPGAALTIPDRAGRANRGAGSDRSRMQQLAQAAETGTITVQRGATLRALARAYLNDAGKWRRFLEVNPELDSSDDLQAGMELSLPPEVTEPVANQPEPIEDPGQGSAGDSSYTVQSGDTLYGIAEKTLGDGGQWERIFEANGDKLDDSDDLEVGMALTIPQ